MVTYIPHLLSCNKEQKPTPTDDPCDDWSGTPIPKGKDK